MSARALIAEQQFDQAKSRLDQAIRLFPDFALAHETFGDLLLVTGKANAAAQAYEHAIRLDPHRAGAHRKLERARAGAASGGEADTAPGEAQRRKRRMRMAFEDEIAKAVDFERDGKPDKAENIYRDILTRDPDHVEAMRLLAATAVANQAFRDAEIFLKRAVKLAPDYARAWVDLAKVHGEMENREEAVASARQVIRLVPEAAESHILYAVALGKAGSQEEAIESYRKALELAPGKAGAMSGLAHRLKTIGRQDEAVATYRDCIAANPEYAEAYWSLANLKTFRFEPAEIEAMHGLLAGESIDEDARVHLHNALGFAYENQQQFAPAFEQFSHGNKIRRLSESYDPVQTETKTDSVIEVFCPDFVQRHAGNGCQDASPILVVGLPRSGSTLLEQILASHSQVEGTHELPDLAKTVRWIQRRRGKRQQGYPEILAGLAAAEWAEIGAEYIERTNRYRSGLPFFIDKNPNNFMYTGLLALALPHAKIINARRHPLDSCLGTFKQLFASGQPFSYDLVEIGEYYLQYSRLMEHWHDVLPGHVLDVDYERVVADLEAQVRRLLDFCGLPFEDTCLRFHETERAVKTASSEQVRQPLYSSSVNLWRNYEPQLATLIEVLAPLLAELPAEARPQVLHAGSPNATQDAENYVKS